LSESGDRTQRDSWLGSGQHFYNQAKYDSQHKTGDNGSRDCGEWVHDFFLKVIRSDSQAKSWAIIRASVIYAILPKLIERGENPLMRVVADKVNGPD
jgi:hypothetical protein